MELWNFGTLELWNSGTLEQKKRGKPLMSHRSTAYPCFLPDLGEFSRSWSYKTYPLQRYKTGGHGPPLEISVKQ